MYVYNRLHPLQRCENALCQEKYSFVYILIFLLQNLKAYSHLSKHELYKCKRGLPAKMFIIYNKLHLILHICILVFNLQSEAFNPPAVNPAILQSAQEGMGTIF